MQYSFPKDFLFGAASSAYQIEGAYKEDGKGWNIWDQHVNNTHPEMENANITCDSYHNIEKDVNLMKHIGFKHYRFSINWTRILPNGDYTSSGINDDGVRYYRNLIAELKKEDIEPVITIYHWDLPHHLQDDFGGWTNPLVVDYMQDYADLLFSLFGNEVKWWITINEPTIILFGYESGNWTYMAPGKTIPSPGNYLVIHHMMLAHARIYRLYDEKYRATQNGKVGMALVGSCYRPKNPDKKGDVDATNIAYEFFLGLFAHPIFTKEGDYPPLVRKIVDENSLIKEGRKRSRLPTFTKEEKESLIGAADFFGVNHYLTHLCSAPKLNAKLADLKPISYHSPINNPMKFFKEDVLVQIEMLQDPQPTGFREILNYIKDHYGNPEIFVTENGLGVQNEPDLNDDDRIDYFTNFLKELWKAINRDKCNVLGYTVWSLMDNFEWAQGYKWKYGIAHVDFDDPARTRTFKKSHKFFRQLLKTGVIPEDDILDDVIPDDF